MSEIESVNERENVTGAKDASTLLAQGRRHFLVKDFDEALACLGEACSLLAQQYGKTAYECGDAYLIYGKALLEVARIESGVLGDSIALPDDVDDTDDDTDEEEKEKQASCVRDESIADGEEQSQEACEDAGNEDGKKEQMRDEISKNSEIPDNDDSGSDISALNHAWEMLEVAKIIFHKHADDEGVSLKLADAYLHLGLVGLESETYDQAIDDMKTCLEIQKKHLDESNRAIAETYFNLGTAYSLNSNLNEAKDAYCKSLRVLQSKCQSLENKLNYSDINDKYKFELELKELETVVPEIEEKIQELENFKVDSIRLAKEFMQIECSKSIKNETSEAQVVSNISHLVRKKRRADEDGESGPDNVKPGTSEDVPAKIQKTEL